MPVDCPVCGHDLNTHSGVELFLCTFNIRYRFRERVQFIESVQSDIEEL